MQFTALRPARRVVSFRGSLSLYQFLDSCRVAARPESSRCIHQKRSLVCGKPTGMMTFDESQMALFLELSLRPTNDSQLYSTNGGRSD
jgi:hypothetical protein